MKTTMPKHNVLGFPLARGRATGASRDFLRFPAAVAAALLLLGTGAALAQGASLTTDAPASSSASTLTAKGIEAALGKSKPATVSTGQDEFLQPDEAFRFNAFPDGSDHVKLIWQIADGYYLYRSRVKAATTSDKAQLGALEMPAGEF